MDGQTRLGVAENFRKLFAKFYVDLGFQSEICGYPSGPRPKTHRKVEGRCSPGCSIECSVSLCLLVCSGCRNAMPQRAGLRNLLSRFQRLESKIKVSVGSSF